MLWLCRSAGWTERTRGRWTCWPGWAGYFRVPVRQVDRWRQLDASFPQARILSGGTARWSLADLRAWAGSKARGFCTTGGLRGRVACEESPSERLKKPRRAHAPCEAPDGLRDGDSSEAAR
jgi:hypothetical protein